MSMVITMAIAAIVPWIVSFLLPLDRVTVTGTSAADAAKLMKDWGIWLTGIQTGAIAALGAMFKGPTGSHRSVAIAVFFFTLSIIIDTILLAGLPSVLLRLKPDANKENDIYDLQAFTLRGFPRIGVLYTVSHWYFVFGIIAFCIAFGRQFTPWAQT